MDRYHLRFNDNGNDENISINGAQDYNFQYTFSQAIEYAIESAKVMLWKMAIQHYIFDVQHIPGKQNTLADNFSRTDNCLAPEDPLNGCVEKGSPFVVRYLSTNPYFFESVTNHLLTIQELDMTAEQYLEISKVHGPSCGHCGRQVTLKRLRAAGHDWPRMRKHVTQFLRHCPSCQKMSALRPVIHSHPYTLASYRPWDRVAVDTIGPLPVERNGSLYHCHY